MEYEGTKNKRFIRRFSWKNKSTQFLVTTKPKASEALSLNSAGGRAYSQETGDHQQQSPMSPAQVGNTSNLEVSNSNSDNNALSRAMSTKMVKVETGHGVLPEDVVLARRLKNPVEFALNYMKVWCKTCKEVAVNLDRRGACETESCRTTAKYFQSIESILSSSNGVPMKSETTEMARCLLDQCKEIELQNSKFCRGLLEVLHRQHMSVEKARKHLKDQWKAEVKRMVDAENSLIKTKSIYYRSCQTGVRLREDLAAAQNLLDDHISTVNILGGHSLAGNPAVSGTSGPSTPGASAITSPAPMTLTAGGGSTSATSNSSAGSQVNLGPELVEPVQSVTENAALSQAVNQMTKQKVKVERLEKQLSDNDKKEFEQMYAYRETVETANTRLHELEKRKMEIICDVRLTITKSDEVVKNTLAEYFTQLYNTRMLMIQRYSEIGEGYQNYTPCAAYLSLSQEVIQTEVDKFPEKYQFIGFHEAGASGLKVDLSARGSSRNQPTFRDVDYDSSSGLLVHSDSDSEGEGETTTAGTGASSTTASTIHTSRYTSNMGSSNVLSSLVEFGSSLFRPDSKKSLRGKRPASTAVTAALVAAANQASAESEAAQLANTEKEYVLSCRLLSRCVAAIEQQAGGLETHGIYRVPASKSKVSSLLEYLQSNQPTNRQQVTEDLTVLMQEPPMTLAGLIKTQLIALPEPLLTYNLYQQFVDLGKAADSADSSAQDELIRRLQDLIGQLLPANRQLAGLIFHHLHRVSLRQSDNKMNSANLGCMFGPTVLRQRPKFQVANMMDFVDNKGQIKITEVMIDNATKIFGASSQFDPVHLITSEPVSYGNAPAATNQSETSGKTSTGSLSMPFVDSSPSSMKVFDVKDTTASHASSHKSGSSSATVQGSSLLRSATISTTQTSKTGYLGSSMPLYTPYGVAQSTGPKPTVTASSVTVGTSTSSDARPQTGRRMTSTATGGNPSSSPSEAAAPGEHETGIGAISSLMVGLRIPATRLAFSSTSPTVDTEKRGGTSAGSGLLNSSEYSYIDTDPAETLEL